MDLDRPRPGGGMAYAEDLKSFVLNGTCGFDPHPGHSIIVKRACVSSIEKSCVPTAYRAYEDFDA